MNRKQLPIAHGVGWDARIVAITKLREQVAITKLGEQVAVTKLGEQVAITKLREWVAGNTKGRRTKCGHLEVKTFHLVSLILSL